MIGEFVTWLLNSFLGFGVRGLGVALTLAAGSWYLWKAKAIASRLGSAASYAIFAAIVLAMLVVLGIVPTIRFSRAADLLSLALDWTIELVTQILP